MENRTVVTTVNKDLQEQIVLINKSSKPYLRCVMPVFDPATGALTKATDKQNVSLEKEFSEGDKLTGTYAVALRAYTQDASGKEVTPWFRYELLEQVNVAAQQRQANADLKEAVNKKLLAAMGKETFVFTPELIEAFATF